MLRITLMATLAVAMAASVSLAGTYSFQDGVNSYAGTNDSLIAAGSSLEAWSPGYVDYLRTGQDFFFANAPWMPGGADDWRPFRSIISFNVTSLQSALAAGEAVQSATLKLTKTGTSGTFTDTPIELSRLPAADAGWREGTTDWNDIGAATWWYQANPTVWSGGANVLVASTTASSTDAIGTVYTFDLTDVSFIADWINNPATSNAGFHLVAPVIEYGDPGYLWVDYASSEHATQAYRPELIITTGGGGVLIPEPATIALLTLGGALVGLRRRK